MYAFTFTIPLDVLQQRTEQFVMPLKKDLSETNFSGFLMRIELSSRKTIGTSPHLNVISQAKEWYRLWCIHMSCECVYTFTCVFTCHIITVVERQPFRPYSQRRASRWNGQRFINSCVSFAHWKRFTQRFPVDGRLPARFWQQRNPKNQLEMQDLLIASPQSPLFVSCNAWLANSPQNYALTWWIISEVIQPPRMELISVNLSISGHGTLICEEWLWKVNGVTGLPYGA